MNEDNIDNFKFGSDQENPDEVLKDASQIQGNRISKLSRRVTILAVILPCLIGVTLFFLYLDLKDRVAQNQTTGSRSMENLGRDLDARLQDVTARLTQLEAGITERAAETEKSVGALKTQIGKLESALKNENESLKKIDAAKADKKDQESLSSQLTTIATQLKTLDAAFSDRLSTMSAAVLETESDVVALKGDVANLQESKIDGKTLKNEIDLQQQRLTVLSNDVTKKMASLQAEIRKLEKDLQQARQSYRPPPTTKPPVSTAPAPGTAPGGPGSIVEKNLE